MKFVVVITILSFIKDKMQIFMHFVLYNSHLRLQYHCTLTMGFTSKKNPLLGEEKGIRDRGIVITPRGA